MPTVPRYERGVGTRPLPAARKSAAETPLSTGAGVSLARGRKLQQVADFGGVVERIGLTVYTGIQQQERDRADQVAALEWNNRYSEWKNKRLYDPQAGAFTQQGKNAMGLPEQIATEFQLVTGEIEAGLSNDRQRLAFQRYKAQESANLDLDVRRHVFREMQTYEATELTSTIENAHEAAVANAQDPRRVGEELDRAVSAIKTSGPRLGFGPAQIEKQVADVTSATHVGVIEQLLATEKDKAAKVYFEETRGQISGPAIARVERALEEGTIRGESQRKADAILAAGGTFTEQLDKVKAIDDPKLRDATRERVEHQKAVDDRITRERDEQTLRGAYDLVDKSKDVRSIPPATWASLSGGERSALRGYAHTLAKGVPVVTDLPTFYGLMQKAGDDPAAFATENLLAYRHKLDEVEFKQLASLQLSIRTGDKNKAEKDLGSFRTHTQILDDTLNQFGIDPKPDDGSPEAKKLAQLRRMLDTQVQAQIDLTGKKPTNDDIQDMADNLLSKEVAADGPWYKFFAPTTKRLLDLTIDDVPKGERDQIVKSLQEHRRPVSDATILDVYISTRARLGK